jgi:hypothetical protein
VNELLGAPKHFERRADALQARGRHVGAERAKNCEIVVMATIYPFSTRCDRDEEAPAEGLARTRQALSPDWR